MESLDLALRRDRAVAVTGATGFLGSHVTRPLTNVGADVVVLVRDEDRPTPVTVEWDLSAEKARTMLDWKPRFAVAEGLADTVAWYRSFLGEARS